MSLCRLASDEEGTRLCPTCGERLNFVEGGAVSVVNGKLDMEAVKPKYECYSCNVFYREVLNTDFFDVFPLKKNEERAEKKTERPCSQEPVPLKRGSNGSCVCPNCGKPLRFVEGGAVCVVNGKADMDNIKPKYECDTCGVYYREVLSSGYYHAYELPCEEKEQKKIISTGDLQPVLLKKDSNGKCVCPRCGSMMDYIDGQAVKLVNGKPDMENVKAHFLCNNCRSVFRRIVNTDYFQWSEK